MAAEAEGAAERARRNYQRGLFDGEARLYAATRPGYPRELAEFTADTAGAGPGTPVLEVGCGTGQLTQQLVPQRFALTAIDLGTSMIEVAREHIAAGVTFRAVSFEELDVRPASFGLIISGAAFHWIDPEIRFRKAARLLRPGGWLAVADSRERYDEPLDAALEALWRARAAEDGAWVTRPANGAAIRASGLFHPPVHREFRQLLVRSPADVIGLERTRATSLSWPDQVRRGFFAELGQLLADRAEVVVTVESSVTMAQVVR